MNKEDIDICNSFIRICSDTIKSNTTIVNIDSMLHQINMLVCCDYSLLLKYSSTLNEIELITLKMSLPNAPETDINDMCVLTKFIFNYKVVQNESIIAKIIESKRQSIYNNVHICDIVGINDALSHTEMTICAIPAIHLNDICGVLFLCGTCAVKLPPLLDSVAYVLGALIDMYQPSTNDMFLATIDNAYNCCFDDGLIIADKTKIVYANNNAIDMLGADIINKNVCSVFHCLSWPPATDIEDAQMRILPFFSVGICYYAVCLYRQKSETETVGLTDSSSDSTASTPHVIQQCASSDLMAYFSHEIRNPIQTISSGVYVLDHTLSNLEAFVDGIAEDNTMPIQAIEGDLAQSTESLCQNKAHSPKSEIIKKTMAATIKRVEKACKNMSIIVDDVLDISKIDNDALTLTWANVNMQYFCDIIYVEFYEKAKKKKLSFTYNISDNVPINIYTDETRLFQILSNLITNAIKYCDHGEICMDIKYNTSNDTVLFSVLDQGDGISKDDEAKLFTKYGRAATSCRNAKSNGLGLYVSQKIAQLLGGTIEFVYNNGTTFTLIHPCFQTKHIIQQTPVAQTHLTGNILVANTDPDELNLFKLLLQCISYDYSYNLNIDIHLLDSPYLTNKSLNNNANTKKYDIIFIDGNTIVKELLFAQVVAIVSTDIPQLEYINDVIVKPFSNNDIKKLLEKHLLI